MASCCGPARVAPPARLDMVCPRCGDPGRTVNNITVVSLVKEGLAGGVGARDYNICQAPSCDVVYYSDGGAVFSKGDLRIRVAYKEPEGPRTVCYCYGLTEDDILAEMRTNPKARAFSDVAAIFGLNSCRCENYHPFGGSCACGADVGKVVKKGRVDAIVRESDRARASMKKVYIFERQESCCGPSPSAGLVAFLERKYRDRVDLKVFNLAATEDNVPVPPSLIRMMQESGAACLPAMVVNDAVVARSGLPTFIDAVQLIEGRTQPA